MRKIKEPLGFSGRLVAAMQARGHFGRGSVGVDVHALADAASTSYEMARRYVEGHAIPRPEKLALIAEWLGVESGALLWGEPAQTRAPVDLAALQRCIEIVTNAQVAAGKTLSSEHFAEVVSVLYGDLARGVEPPTPELVARLLRAT